MELMIFFKQMKLDFSILEVNSNVLIKYVSILSVV
jgi:hypothetical protein